MNHAKLSGLTSARPAKSTVQRGNRVVSTSVVLIYAFHRAEVSLAAGTIGATTAAASDMRIDKGDLRDIALGLTVTAAYFPPTEKLDATRQVATTATAIN